MVFGISRFLVFAFINKYIPSIIVYEQFLFRNIGNDKLNINYSKFLPPEKDESKMDEKLTI